MSCLAHYGTPRHSGRYPWGSGDNPYQRTMNFLSQVNELRDKGMTEKEIAEGRGISIKQYRDMRTIANAEKVRADVAQAVRLREKGMSNVEIGKRMGINESSVRSLLNPSRKLTADIMDATANMLKESIDRIYPGVDIGPGVERYLGISRTKLDATITKLLNEGFKVDFIHQEQPGNPNKYTTVTVLSKADTTYKELYANRAKIKMPTANSEDKGLTYTSVLGLKPIQSVDSSRIAIAYKETGGAEKDGTIELRRGVADLDLKNSRYAQVRIGVDGTHYLKGMAIYRDDMPPGIDIIYNTNKAVGTDPKKVFKPMKTNADGSLNNDNPFGASIKPGGQRGALNIIQEEGDWNSWSKTLSTQMLSKQKPSLAKQQLNLTYAERMDEFDSIIKLTNNTVKKHFLSSFADSCDADAVHLDAAGLPRQAWKVILPVPSLKDNEVYAPTFKNGEQVVLIRHPHGGIFEIPELRVNNKNAAAKSVLGNAKDAVAINSKVAEVLSGADFDGDTVLVIPNNSRSVKTSAPLQGLKDFDPRAMYAYSDSDIASGAASIMTNAIKQQQMGNVSNLITDMTIKGASNDEIARAVRHSMVVIDAEKHKYDYKQSAIDNGIAQLKKEYQGGANRGASTLISRASSEMYVDARKDQVRIDPKTGQQLFQPKGETYEQVKKVKNQDGTTTYVPTGKMLTRKTKSTKMAEVKDAYELSSGTTIENYYADYANKMKALANQTRKELVATPNLKYDPTAKKVYAAEVESLNAKLNLALMNAPLERQAILIADTTIRATRQANPDMDKDEIKKLKSQALQGARQRTGADKKSRLIDITDKEWEAIQNGAITHTTLTSILQNANDEAIRARAMPKPANALSSTQRSRIKAMLATGYTQAEIAAQLGISVSTINNMD